jgi:hypothetical protein
MKHIMTRMERIAKRITAETSLDGMTPTQAKREVNKLLAFYTKGLFKDQSWKPIDDIWTALTAAQIDWTMTGAKYDHDEHGVTTSKTWKFYVEFTSKTGSSYRLYGVIVASSAGSVQDPLGRYDVVAYVS